MSEHIEPFVAELAEWHCARVAVGGAAAGLQAIHLYPFGGLAPSLRWLRTCAENPELRRAMPLHPMPPSGDGV